ncbi:hypothetical protein RJ639_005177 [Escallonia herrerae]|uniref:KIB1-4 beta-propeller domain-containing protein n=1 Tax=Escallonia herrerae TaxID=1293975 RepID=A0AA88W1C1_9ASTE|nr:hypothetical protein RJ639_005177 [Escallonia herrerae]
MLGCQNSNEHYYCVAFALTLSSVQLSLYLDTGEAAGTKKGRRQSAIIDVRMKAISSLFHFVQGSEITEQCRTPSNAGGLTSPQTYYTPSPNSSTHAPTPSASAPSARPGAPPSLPSNLPLLSSPPLPLPFPISPNPHLHRLRRGHFSLSDSTVYLLQPLTTSKAWLIRIEEDGKNGKFRPLNSLSRTLSEHVPKSFPKVLNLLNFRVTEIGTGFSLEFVETSKKNVDRKFEELKSILVKKAVVSSSPWTVSSDDYAIKAIHAGKLAFIKLGDEKWTLFDDPKQCDDVVYHKGCFYAVDYKGRTVVIGADLMAKEIAAPMPGRGGGQFKHLVKSGEINPEVQVHVKVFKLNEKEKEWQWVDSLGGDDCSYSVSARDYDGLKGDCVYFCDDEFQSDDLGELCTDIGVYRLKDSSCGSVASFASHSQLFWPPPTWLKPNPSASKK